MVWLIGGSVFVMDQLSKWLAVSCLIPSSSLKLIPPILHLTLVYNRGAAFGLLPHQTLFFIVVALVAIGVILRYSQQVKGIAGGTSWGLGLLLGGTMGNLVDRLRLGYVVDFLDFRVWPVFNLADSAITIGTAILALQMIRRRFP